MMQALPEVHDVWSNDNTGESFLITDVIRRLEGTDSVLWVIVFSGLEDEEVRAATYPYWVDNYTIDLELSDKEAWPYEQEQ